LNLITGLRHIREKSLVFIIGQTGGKSKIRDTAQSDLPHRIKKKNLLNCLCGDMAGHSQTDGQTYK